MVGVWRSAPLRDGFLLAGSSDLSGAGVENPFEARPSSPREEETLLALGSKSTGKRKDTLGCEKACSEATSLQRLRGSDSDDQQPSGFMHRRTLLRPSARLSVLALW